MTREVKVGALVVVALAALAAGIFLVGERNNLFALKNGYFVHFKDVGGLAAGNPVQLSGVTVGRVERVVLPKAVDEKLLTVWISLDRDYADRIREDSVARIKTLGLLGDKYIEISSGSPESRIVAVDGEIKAAAPTDVDRLLTSGEDAVDNVVAISYSLRSILDRVEAGEGLLGELLIASETGERAKESVVDTLSNFEIISGRLARGQGTIGQLLADDKLAARLEGSMSRLETVLDQVETGEGTLAALIGDPEMKSEVIETLGSLRSAAEGADRIVTEFHDNEGLLQRFLSDETFANDVTRDLKELIENLNVVSEKLEKGEGALGQIINDPHLYQAMDDIVVGINESRLLRWLIRNRQKAGIEKRFDDAGGDLSADPSEPAAPATP
ncbi:MAG: MCE family protein [bacterium]|nr:MCE family protein [bacterium]